MRAAKDPAVVAERRRALVAEHGDWTSHYVDLGEGLPPLGEAHPEFENLAALFFDYVSYFVHEPIERLRFLDLACLEGGYTIEAARRGAREAVGIEGRRANIAHAEFAADVLGLSNARFVQDDVRNLSVAKYGEFDVTFCLGILYHLDAPDCFEFVQRIAEVTRSVALIDTHFAPHVDRGELWRGSTYGGCSFAEAAPGDSTEVHLTRKWASLDNPRSFWIAESDLFRLLYDVGFDRVFRADIALDSGCHRDLSGEIEPVNRIRLLAVKSASRNPTVALRPAHR